MIKKMPTLITFNSSKTSKRIHNVWEKIFTINLKVKIMKYLIEIKQASTICWVTCKPKPITSNQWMKW